jgi:OmpA-OmpF porin, OOP family
MQTILIRSAALALLALAVTPDANAQILRRARDAAQRGAERAVEREAERRTEQATADALGAPDARPAGASGAAPASGDAAPAADRVLVHYDFVPGERVIFSDDFTGDAPGDFPRRLRFGSGNFEVAEWQGRRFVRGTAFGAVAIELPEDLPARFTLEMDVAAPSGWTQELRFADDARAYVRFAPAEAGIDGAARSVSRPAEAIAAGELFTIRVMADGDHVKVYQNGTRVANVPSAALGRSRHITVRTSASVDHPVLLGAIRIAAGGRELAQVEAAATAVAPAEPLVLHGVTFETGSARLAAESGPTLDAVARGLLANTGVRVRIEGHTDSTGDAARNQTLSEARAAAVREALVARGVAAERLETAGFGPDQPVADNATPEGRQQNRRVALVRL